jgi:hypothetical protein
MDMLSTANDASFEDLPTVSAIMIGALVGPMQNVMNAGAPSLLLATLRHHSVELCVGYLNRVSLRRS